MDFAGLAFFAGEPALGLPLDFGVEARTGVPFGGGRWVLSFAVNLNFGGGEIDFSGASEACGIGASSRRAAIHCAIPYSAASSIAIAASILVLQCHFVHLTIMLIDPHVASYFVMRGRRKSLDVVPLGVLFRMLRPWKSSFKHACRAYKAIAATSLDWRWIRQSSVCKRVG